MVVILAKLVDCPRLVNSPTIGQRADKIDRLVYTQISQGLRKVVERFNTSGLNHKYLTLTVADGSTDSLTFWLVVNHLTIFHKRVLAEEVAAIHRRLLKEGGVFGNSDSHLAVD